MPKVQGKHFSKRTMLIAGALITVAVLGFIYWRKKQSAAQPQAAFSQDTTGGLPGQNYLPATGNFGASQLGQGVTAPPPPTPAPPPPTTCPDGSPPNPDGTCPGSPPPQPPPPVSTTYKHGCFDGAGPGCGGPNRHCEYWTVSDGTGQPAPPPDCVPQGGGQAPGGQSPAKAPAQSPTVTADILSGLSTQPNSLAGMPGLQQPEPLADASVRLLHVTQYTGRGNPSNPYEAVTAGTGWQIGPAPPPTFPPPTNVPPNPSPDPFGPPNIYPPPPTPSPGGGGGGGPTAIGPPNRKGYGT